MVQLREEVEERMRALTLLKEQREEEEENRNQMYRTAGMRSVPVAPPSGAAHMAPPHRLPLH